MESEEFKVMLVIILGVCIIASQLYSQTVTYEAGFNAGKISILAPEKANKE